MDSKLLALIAALVTAVTSLAKVATEATSLITTPVDDSAVSDALAPILAQVQAVTAQLGDAVATRTPPTPPSA